MDITQIQSFLASAGNWISNISANIISYLSLSVPAKVITILIAAILLYVVMKVMEKPLKWLIILLLAFSVVSVFVSLVT